MTPFRGLSKKFLGGIITLGGLGIIIYGSVNLYYANSSNSWNETSGLIIRSEIKKSRTENGYQYDPDIVYSYRIGKKKFQSRRIMFGQSFSNNSIEAAKFWVDKYPFKSKITVFYDPTRPKNATLIKGATNGNYFTFFIGTIFMIGGFGIIIAIIRKENNPWTNNHSLLND